jgi:cytochrome P450
LRMEDILAVTKRRDVEQSSKYLGSTRPAIPLGLDGPEHTKYRRLLDPVFSARRIAPLADRVRDLAGRMIDEFLADGSVNAYSRWCEPLPSSIFLSILGLPQKDLGDFLRFKEMMIGSSQSGISAEDAVRRKSEAVEWIQNYLTANLDAREAAEPKEDLLGWLITTEVDGQRLTREDTLDILGLLMVAGLDTVAASLACFLAHFSRYPGDRDLVISDPDQMRGAVEELLRFETPVTDGGRIALADFELPSGEKITADTHINLSWSAANLDPAYFPDPLTVDFGRSSNRHIAFASGFHRCLGSHLARMELQVALEVWHQRIPNYGIEEGVELVYSGNPRAPHYLPLVWR